MAEVLITGSTGFVGKHLTRKLMKLGADVVPLSHLKVKEKTVWSELRSFDSCRDIVSEYNPKIIFHLAAQPIVETAMKSPFSSMETNIRGAYNLLESIRLFGTPSVIVWMSTDKVYGESKNNASNETDSLSGDSHPYNASKMVGEVLARLYAQVYDLPVVIIRSGNIYGESDLHWNRLVPGVSRDLIKGERPKIRSNGNLKRDYLYVDDVVDGLILASTAYLRKELSKGEAVNFGSELNYSVLEIVDKLTEFAGRIDLTPVIENRAVNELSYQHLDYTVAKEKLGWTPKTSLDDGLEKTFQWYKHLLGDKK